MKTISDFEIEEYRKMLEQLGVNNDDNEDKSQYFNAWNFGEDKGAYITLSESQCVTKFSYQSATKWQQKIG